MGFLKGKIIPRGVRGYSAYEIAIQNGFNGSERDWLASLGTSSQLTKNSISYNVESNQQSFSMTNNYSINDVVLVFVNGILNNDYTIQANELLFNEIIENGSVVEIITLKNYTNDLPIVQSMMNVSENTVLSTQGLKNYLNEFTTEEIEEILDVEEE